MTAIRLQKHRSDYRCLNTRFVQAHSSRTPSSSRRPPLLHPTSACLSLLEPRHTLLSGYFTPRPSHISHQPSHRLFLLAPHSFPHSLCCSRRVGSGVTLTAQGEEHPSSLYITVEFKHYASAFLQHEYASPP
jgi:hypothetical protein